MTTSFLARAAAFAAATLLLIVVGCVSSPTGPGRAVLEQKGQVTVRGGEEKDVFFTMPYGKAPSIEVKDDWQNSIKVVDCKPDHFRVRNDSYVPQIVHVDWTASGDRPASTTPPAAPPPTK